MTIEIKLQHTVLDALQALSACCDGARSQDGQGFNGRDTAFGKSLARQSSLSAKQEIAARKMLVTYTKQLAAMGINVAELASCTHLDRHIAQVERMQATHNGHAPQPTVQQVDGRTVKMNATHIIFTFPYDPQIKDDLKDTFRSARFDGASKTWSISGNEITNAILWGKKWHFDVTGLEAALIERNQAAQEAAQKADIAYQARMANITDTGEIILRAYQHDGVQFLVQREKAILADDMGLGKTLQALVASKAYKNHACFVIAPKSLHGDWREAARRCGAKIEIYTWRKIPAAPDLQDSPGTMPYIVIADEAHKAQNLQSAQTKALIALSKDAKALFLLTGTPIKNGRPVNLYPLLSMINHPIAKDKKQYEKRYCAAGPTRFTAWDNTGAAFLAELNEKISDSMLRRTKKQCLPDLPAKTRVLRMVEPSTEDARLYDTTYHCLRSEYAKRLAAGKISDGWEALVMLTHLRHAASVAKVGNAVELAEEILEQGESVVVFFEFDDSVQKFITEPRIAQYGVSHMSADLSTDKRDLIKAAFMNGSNKVFCCTIKTGGVGLTLTAASTVLLCDRPWTPGDAVQAEDRIHRIGQKNACTAYWLRYGHIDESIDTLLAEKAEKIGVVLGDDTVKIDYANMATQIF